MATEERKALAELGTNQGWSIRESGNADIYLRGGFRVRAIWQGDSALSGASVNTLEGMDAYTRELSTVRTWLQK
jgi:hypothetical protein